MLNEMALHQVATHAAAEGPAAAFIAVPPAGAAATHAVVHQAILHNIGTTGSGGLTASLHTTPAAATKAGPGATAENSTPMIHKVSITPAHVHSAMVSELPAGGLKPLEDNVAARMASPQTPFNVSYVAGMAPAPTTPRKWWSPVLASVKKAAAPFATVPRAAFAHIAAAKNKLAAAAKTKAAPKIDTPQQHRTALRKTLAPKKARQNKPPARNRRNRHAPRARRRRIRNKGS